MSARHMKVLALAISALALASASKFAFSAQDRTQLGVLNASEGIYVDLKGFGVIKGTAKSDPTDHIMKLGGQEVKQGAIIVRVGEKLYLVDADPASKSMYAGWAADAFAGN